MCTKNQMFLICIVSCLFLLFTAACGSELKHTKTLNHRVKRGGNVISNRPLFVYKQQQKEKQEKWRLQEAEKLAEQLHLQSHFNSIEDNSKHTLDPKRTTYTYVVDPVYSNYQAPLPYQVNPIYQPYQSYQGYPANSYAAYQYRPYDGTTYTSEKGAYYD